MKNYKDSPVPNYVTVHKDAIRDMEDTAKYWHDEWVKSLEVIQVLKEENTELEQTITKLKRVNYWLDLFDRTMTLNGYKTTVICTLITSPLVYYLVTR